MIPKSIQISVMDGASPESGATLISGASSGLLNIFEVAPTSGEGVGGAIGGAVVLSAVPSYSLFLPADTTLCITHTDSHLESVAQLNMLAPSHTSALFDTSGDFMMDHISVIDMDHLGVALSQNLPKVQSALDGAQSLSELNQLIGDMQSQLLHLHEVAKSLFGDLGSEIQETSGGLQALATEELLASLSVDAASLGVPAHAWSEPLATLDGLFSHPEAFPLTLDFTDNQHVKEAFDLFASTETHSISSHAGPEDFMPLVPGDKI